MIVFREVWKSFDSLSVLRGVNLEIEDGLTTAIIGDPPTFYQVLNPAGSRGGSEILQDLAHAGLSIVDREGSLRPQLASAVPSLENGMWQLLPDGRMQTTWMIRPGAAWQDGALVTAGDLVFTIEVGRDPDLPEFRDGAYASIEAVEAIDPGTVLVSWSKTYISAGSLFTRGLAPPLPRHLLERAYSESKAAFSQLPYFAEQYVGAGPYELREWIRASRVSFAANDRYVLGRPKIDQIELRVIPDPNTLVANVLAGELDATLGKTLSLEQALEVQRQWRNGRMEVAQANPLQIHPQFLDPDPAVIGDVRFRRALYQRVDRRQLVDALLAGQSMVAESWLSRTTRLSIDRWRRALFAICLIRRPRFGRSKIWATPGRRMADSGIRLPSALPLSSAPLRSMSTRR